MKQATAKFLTKHGVIVAMAAAAALGVGAAALIVGGAAITSSNAHAEPAKVITSVDCVPEVDQERCTIHYQDGSSEEITRPLGTMAIETTITGVVYRDTTTQN